MELIKNNPQEIVKKIRNKINGFIRRKRFIPYNQSFSFAEEISVLMQEIEKNLLPLDPAAAWKLTDRIVRNDGKIIESVDDSGGAVGTELNALSILWLKAAKMMKKPESYWIPLVKEIDEGDDYGCRNDFLSNSDILLSEKSLFEMYNGFKEDLLKSDRPSSESYDFNTSSIRIKMGQTAVALRRPNLYKESVTIAYPEPNNLQILDIIKIYIELGDPDGARKMLDEGKWSVRDKYDVERYYKEIFRKLGDSKNLLKIYKQAWKDDPSLYNLNEYLEIAHKKDHPKIIAEACKIAQSDTDYSRAASVFIQHGKIKEAENIFLANQEYFGGQYYTTLLDLLNHPNISESVVALIVLYRSLLLDLLERGYSKAYNHAAKYYKKLQKLDKIIREYPDSLIGHTEFDSLIREIHGKKYSFWKRVE